MLVIRGEWSCVGVYYSNVTNYNRMYCHNIFTSYLQSSQVNIFILIATLRRIYNTAEKHFTGEQHPKIESAK